MKKEETKQKCEHCKQFISKYGCACGGQIKEPTQRLEKYSERFENKDNELVEGVFNPENWGKRLVKEEPKQETLDFISKELDIERKRVHKQETLEEAAERLHPTTIDSFTDTGIDMSETERLIFINGAKWQQEQNKNLYSDEDVLEFTQWKDDNFLMYNNKTYYAKTSSLYFDSTKYIGKEKPTKYYTLTQLFQQFKKK